MGYPKRIFQQEFLVNRVIWLLTASDIFTWGLYIVVSAFVGIYLSHKLEVDTIEILGIGTAVYHFAKGFFQIPIGVFTDKVKSDRDDIILLFLGNLLMGIPFLFFPLITDSLFYFFLQFVIGVGAAMNIVNWRKLFAKNLDNGREGFTYGLYDTIFSLAAVLFSVIAGFVAGISEDYFNMVMIAIGILIMSGGLWSISIFLVRKRKTNIDLPKI